ncbi:hypothetical protein TREES_T100003921 [Tupaia chinensis]|uniref:Uncharacterized protein n=1 Tax=Tupaia chinensis TaxID=246437 RepID=L9KZL1_TUPCH|nr:hypothetical protein TREES_T100003921 [Tupaia chinensis]
MLLTKLPTISQNAVSGGTGSCVPGEWEIVRALGVDEHRTGAQAGLEREEERVGRMVAQNLHPAAALEHSTRPHCVMCARSE